MNGPIGSFENWVRIVGKMDSTLRDARFPEKLGVLRLNHIIKY